MTTCPWRLGGRSRPGTAGRGPRRRRSPWLLWEAVEARLLLAGGLDELFVQGFSVTRPTAGAVAPGAFTVGVAMPTGESQITVDYTAVPINAVNGVDYQLGFPSSGTLTFGLNGPFTQSLPVKIPGSTQDGGPHEIQVTLSKPIGGNSTGPATISKTQGSALGVIDDNALPGTLQFSAPDYPVSTLGGTVNVTVTRTSGTASGVSVPYATGGGTAVPNVDYVPTSGTLDFGFGVTSQTFPVTILPNFLLDQPRTIGLTLSNPTTAGLTQSPPGVGATLGPLNTTSVVTITPVNSLIVTNTNDQGFGSLRQAIQTSNRLPGPNTITFDIPGPGPHVIAPNSRLPMLNHQTVVDARTEPGYAGTPVVVLDGSNAGSATNGLELCGGSSGIFGLAVEHFGGSGVLLASNHNTLQADWLGTDPYRSGSQGNGYDGVYVVGGPVNPGTATGNRVVGNVISGNGNVGVDIVGANAARSAVLGNLIGTDATGAVALPNGHGGVFINGAASNVVGGPQGGRNVISGNGGPGVVASGAGATSNVVQNNLIGTDATGKAALGNSGDGIFLDNAPGNSFLANVISANGLTGFRTTGVQASGNVLLGNKIGTDISGTSALGNTYDGVFLNGSPGNTVGNGSVAGRNVISANGSSGLQVFGGSAAGNRVLGNLIGTDATGTAPLGNRRDGVFLNAAPGNAIGGAAAGAGNVISANLQVGLQVFTPASTGNVIEGNLIGTDLQGAPVLGNAFGLFLNQAPDNTIGGNNAPGPNTIAGNGTNIVVPTSSRGNDAVLLSTTPQVAGSAITGVVLSFNQSLDARRAQDVTNYSLRAQGPGGLVGARIAIAAASYDPGSNSVTLALASPVPVAGTYRLTIKAGPKGGLKSASGEFLDGDFNNLPGGTSITFIRNGQGFAAPGTARKSSKS